MTFRNFRLEIDADGVALAIWDMPGKSMNVIDESVMDDLEALVEKAGDANVKGVVVASAKPAFSAGADLSMLDRLAARYASDLGAEGEEAATAKLMHSAARLSSILRRLETCGKPFAAAIAGAALGGGLELCLACHYRVAAADADIKLGLPESKVGLLPGAGGTQRLPRLIGAEAALKLMLQGRDMKPEEALKLGAVNKLAPAADVVSEAKRWIREGGSATQPWDQKGFRQPGGAVYSPQGMLFWPAANAFYRKETYDNYAAQRAIMKCVYEGLTVKTIDAGLKIEARYFTHLLKGAQARNMIRSLFFSMQDLGKGARRPADIPATKISKIGLIGAGFMGAGIAYVSARAGIDVVLIDRDDEAAEKGKRQSADLMDREIAKGRSNETEREAVLSRIQATTDYASLAGCDLVIEAVFENRDTKAEVLPRAEAQLADGAVLSSNTSTLPITGLAAHLQRPRDFIGIHFFSPVDRMQLVELILGKKTSPRALALALDYVRRIRKTPIVVNDSRGFYTSRVVMTYIAEGHYMLDEGVPAALIENAGRMAGMPVGPLALNDEVALDLSWKILQATKADLGDKYSERPIDRILEELVEKRGRQGRKNAKGFYDYPQAGRKRLWPDLPRVVAAKSAEHFDPETIKERLLLIQALETARCFEEGVLTDVREADVGAILGFGFAPFTGGPLSYIDSMGPAAFVAKCKAYAKAHGPRYKPCRLLLDMAKTGEGFYARFSPQAYAA